MPSVVLRSAAAAGHVLPVGTRARNYMTGAASDPIASVNLFFDARFRAELLRPIGGDVRSRPEAPEAYRASLADRNASLLRRAMETDFRTTMVDGYLVKVDRASMISSVEARAPFLDDRLIEFAYGRVPDELKATARERKILLRRVARRVLPAALNLERKMGFTPPLRSWLAGEWGAEIQHTLEQSEIFDRRAVTALFDAQRRGYNNTHRLYALAFLELWRREYRVGIR